MKLKKNLDPHGGVLVLLLLVGALSFLGFLSSGSAPSVDVANAPVFVQVIGDIPCPGVCQFAESVTLKNLLMRAGLSIPDNRLTGLNATTLIPSGGKVAVRETPEGYDCRLEWMSAFYKVTLGIPIRLNNETEIGLTAVKGIGPALSAAIVLERRNRRGFKTLQELREVPGINDRLYKRIRPFFTL